MTEAVYTATIEASGLAGRALAIRPDLAKKMFSRALTRLWWVIQNREDEAQRSAQFTAALPASSD
jgi:hypothetical protein